jgi:hypothetical protein
VSSFHPRHERRVGGELSKVKSRIEFEAGPGRAAGLVVVDHGDQQPRCGISVASSADGGLDGLEAAGRWLMTSTLRGE